MAMSSLLDEGCTTSCCMCCVWIPPRVPNNAGCLDAGKLKLSRCQLLRTVHGTAMYVGSEAQRQTRWLYWLAAFSGLFPAAAGRTTRGHAWNRQGMW